MRSTCRFWSNQQFHQQNTSQKNENREETPEEAPVHLEYRWYPQQSRNYQRICRPASTSWAQEGRNALPCDPHRRRQTSPGLSLAGSIPTKDRLETSGTG